MWWKKRLGLGDVESVRSIVSEIYPERKMIPFIFSNKETNLPSSYPSYATAKSITVTWDVDSNWIDDIKWTIENYSSGYTRAC